MAKKTNNKILVEYQKAQDSAEHYDTMIWIMIPILLGFSISILYLVFYPSEFILPINLKLVLLIFGGFSLFYFGFLIESANQKKQYKYSICKDIEKKYKFIFKQHRNVDNLFLSKVDYKGNNIMRAARFILYILYFFSVWAVYLDWTIDVEVPIILPIIITIALLLGLIMEFIYKKYVK